MVAMVAMVVMVVMVAWSSSSRDLPWSRDHLATPSLSHFSSESIQQMAFASLTLNEKPPPENHRQLKRRGSDYLQQQQQRQQQQQKQRHSYRSDTGEGTAAIFSGHDI